MWGWFGMAGVVSGCVRMPNVDKNVGKRFAGFYIDNTDVKELVNNSYWWSVVGKRERKKEMLKIKTYSEQTKLEFCNILSDRMANSMIVWTFRHFRS
jgi:hypothetical protein